MIYLEITLVAFVLVGDNDDEKPLAKSLYFTCVIDQTWDFLHYYRQR